MAIKGFSFSAVEAGIRYKGRLDLGLIFSEKPCVTAGVFTTSQVKAASVVIDVKRLESTGYAQAIVVNSGCANACTGREGMEAALATSRIVSARLGVDDELVQLSSTGVIGEQLNVGAFEQNIDSLVTGLDPGKFDDVAKAIMTTDTFHKTTSTKVTVAGKEVNIVGMAKGSGMIMPNMATMLAFVMTDADIKIEQLQSVLRETTNTTFNRITVDGDTSTNDMVLVMANGSAANPLLDGEDPLALQQFKEGLCRVLKDLALQIVTDGEGATKTITIKVRGTASDADAEKIARTIANSNLVKTAFFGEDANWGRIIAAMGRAGVVFDPELVSIAFGDVTLVENGLGLGADVEEKATDVLKEKQFTVSIDLHSGSGFAEMYTCDFSIEYVKINADYRS
ncbi:MAG: bifunctional ornithine acetyltransferase/N-acetylglutamate synthase [Desulfotalea sp.]|nr:MAG: bifunctional ornithine acetyltransferase/N-acetylglutamate synthase [Desulfotalea sp.]